MVNTFYILTPLMNFLIHIHLLCYIVLLYSVTIGKESENNLLFIYRRSGFNWRYVLIKCIALSYCNKVSRLQQRGLGRTGISTIHFQQISTYPLSTSKEVENLKFIFDFDTFCTCKGTKKNRQKNMQIRYKNR